MDLIKYIRLDYQTRPSSENPYLPCNYSIAHKSIIINTQKKIMTDVYLMYPKTRKQ